MDHPASTLMSRRPQTRVCLGRVTGHPEFKEFSLSVSSPTDAEAQRIFGALGDGGQLLLPMAKAFLRLVPRHGGRPL